MESGQLEAVRTKFEVSLPFALAVSLHQWYRAAGGAGDFQRFVNEVFEMPIIEFRRTKIVAASPPSPKRPIVGLTRNGCHGHPQVLTAEAQEELLTLYDNGVKPPELAKRFSVGKTTVYRILDERDV